MRRIWRDSQVLAQDACQVGDNSQLLGDVSWDAIVGKRQLRLEDEAGKRVPQIGSYVFPSSKPGCLLLPLPPI